MSLPVSVVVVNYNGAAYLEACLRSVFAEDPAEVLLVDSGSTDGAHEVAAREFAVRLLTLGGNKGPSAARNFGLREASCDRVLLIDNDVELLPGCLGRLVEHLDANPDVWIIQARSLLGSDAGPVHYDGGTFHDVGLIALRNWYCPETDAGGTGLVPTDVAIALCCIARRDALLAVGGYDERMFILFEDLALSYAIKLAGGEVAAAADARCVHKAGTKGLSTRGESRSYAARRTFLHSRNRWLFVLTHYRLKSLVVLAPAFVWYGVFHLAFVVVSGHLGAWCRGKAALFRQLGYVRRRRRKLQACRKRGDRALLGAPRLTLNPGLADRGLRGLARGVLNGGLRVYHGCVGWLL